MKKSLQLWSAFILILFIFPLAIQLAPGGETVKSAKLEKESAVIVYASNVIEEEIEEEIPVQDANVLLYFTHSHEAYEPITKAVYGKKTVDHQTENVMKVGEKLRKQLAFKEITTDILPVKVPHHRAYQSIRPHVKKSIEGKKYDLIIDIHRDSIGPAKTTTVYQEERYAKVGFVIGTDHPNYKSNKEKAEQLKNEMEKIVPGITRPMIMKGGRGVDGKYNQDLDPNVILIEMGGVGNTEAELNRTVTVIADAAAVMLGKANHSDY